MQRMVEVDRSTQGSVKRRVNSAISVVKVLALLFACERRGRYVLSPCARARERVDEGVEHGSREAQGISESMGPARARLLSLAHLSLTRPRACVLHNCTPAKGFLKKGNNSRDASMRVRLPVPSCACARAWLHAPA